MRTRLEGSHVQGKTFRPGGLALTERALSFCNLNAGSTVLDVGCGAGSTVDWLVTEHHLAGMGVDVCAESLSRARQVHPGLSLAQAAAEGLPFADSSLDAIFAECTFSIFADRARALREFARTLKRDGYLCASDVYLRQSPLGQEMRGVLTQPQIVEQIQANGFCVDRWEDHSSVLQQFAAQMIWAGGSLDNFFKQTGIGCTVGMPLASAREKLGYYLLIARKGDA